MSDRGANFSVELKFSGAISDDHYISLYDLSQALYGFERSLALTTHLVLNNEVITQATSLKGAEIYSKPPKEGSFTVMAIIAVLGTGAYKLTTLKRDNPLGHLVHSAYDFAVHKVTGRDLDYDKSIRQLFEEGKYQDRYGLELPRESRFDSLAEKIEPPLTRMHRPILHSGTAETAHISFNSTTALGQSTIEFSRDTYSLMKYRERTDDIEVVKAKVAVFNPNTFNGRLFIDEEARTIPFFLTHAGRSPKSFNLIGKSYSANLNDRTDPNAYIKMHVLKSRSKLGRLTKFSVIRVEPFANET